MRMIIAQCGAPRGVVHAADFNNRKASPSGTPESDGSLSDLFAELHSNVTAVRYKPAEDKQAQISCRTVVQSGDTSRLAHKWQIKVHALDKDSAYHDKFFYILTESQSM